MATNPQATSVLTHSVQITLRDGSTFTHTAQFARRITAADDPALEGLSGAIMVIEAVCCKGLADQTTYRHTLPNDITGMTTDQIQADISDAVARLATHHASIHKANDFVAGLPGAAASPAASS